MGSSKAFTKQSDEAKEYKKFYQSKQWRNFRLMMKRSAVISQLKEPRFKYYEATKYLYMNEPLCVICVTHNQFTKANTLDHIKPIRLGGGKVDPKNVQWVCQNCHYAKSGGEKQDYRPKTDKGSLSIWKRALLEQQG